MPLLAAGALCTVAALLGATTDVFWWLLVVRCLFGIGMGINKCVPCASCCALQPCADAIATNTARLWQSTMLRLRQRRSGGVWLR